MFGAQVLVIMVASDFLVIEKSIQKISRRIDAYLKSDFEKNIHEMCDEEYEAIKLKFSGEMGADSSAIWFNFDKNWREISSRNYLFNRCEMKIKYLRSIRKSDLLKFCQSHFKNEVRELSFQVTGCLEEKRNSKLGLKIIDGESGDGTKMISDIVEFKDSLELYTLSNTKVDCRKRFDSTKSYPIIIMNELLLF